MDKKKIKIRKYYICPECGGKDCRVEHAAEGSGHTFVHCRGCNYKAVPQVFHIGYQMPSRKPHPNHDPENLNPYSTRGNGGEPRILGQEPVDKFQIHGNPDIVRANKKQNGRKIMANPFLKEQKSSDEKSNPFFSDKRIAKTGGEKNPFFKVAREFQRSPFGQTMKDISEKNMVFPEGKQGEILQDSDEDVRLPYTHSPGGRFNTVDRKEYRSSPKPEDIIPGYKEWKEKNIDKYYDGWLEDHIENSGGELIGSNTEKTMNLNDGERNHPPEYPTEAIYEKLLESRHEFNEDYEKVVANGKAFLIKKSDAEEIRKIAECPCEPCKKEDPKQEESKETPLEKKECKNTQVKSKKNKKPPIESKECGDVNISTAKNSYMKSKALAKKKEKK